MSATSTATARFQVLIVEQTAGDAAKLREADYQPRDLEEAQAWASAFNDRELTEPVGQWAVVKPIVDDGAAVPTLGRREFIAAVAAAPLAACLAGESNALQPLKENAKLDPALQAPAVDVFLVTITDDSGARTAAISLDRAAMEKYAADFNRIAVNFGIADVQAFRVEPKPRGVARVAFVKRPKGWVPTNWQSVPRDAPIIDIGEPMDFRTARGCARVYNDELSSAGGRLGERWALVVANDRKLA